MALTNNVKVNAWLDEVTQLVKPDAVELITGDRPSWTDSPLRQFPRVNLLP